MKRRMITLLVAVVALVLGLSSGAAYAYWTSGGSGAGSATAGTPAGVTVLGASAAPSSKLIPGGTADLVVEVQNPNAYSVTLTSLSEGVPVTAQDNPDCNASTGVSVVSQPNLSTTLVPGPNTLHFATAVTMSSSSASACQGASFRIPVTLTVQR